MRAYQNASLSLFNSHYIKDIPYKALGHFLQQFPELLFQKKLAVQLNAVIHRNLLNS